MKKTIKLIIAMIISGCCATSCLFKDYPVDEYGLIITDRTECAVLNFDLLGTNDISVLQESPAQIDTIAQTINAVVKYRADIKKMWPVFTLSPDCRLEPKVTARMDFTEPKQFTVVSGNRKIRKTYTITVSRANP